MRKALAIVGNVTVAVLVVYTLASHGILEVWIDQSGMGIKLNSVGGYYAQFD